MGKARNNTRMWCLWLMLTLLLVGVLAAAVSSVHVEAPGPTQLALRSILLPGKTSHGHYQIELACGSCHTKAFPSRDDVQESCVKCHAAALKAGDDKHPKSKFTDPRNAERAALLDATYCVTCHVEHKPDLTLAGGVTLPKDYCVICHKDIAKDRPSHAGMGFETCASSGCHHFHDNTALYEDFLLKHVGEPAVAAEPAVPARNFREMIDQLSDYPIGRFPLQELSAAQADYGRELRSTPKISQEWLATAHAKAGVNCSGCHQPTGKAAEGLTAAWVEKPSEKVCASCHGPEVAGFTSGLHGMRLAAGLPPMTPGEARLPMKRDVAHKQLTCTTCHGAHRFDTRAAAVDTCLGCHDDAHSRAYKASSHYRSWQKELAGEALPGSGVSCATCHMPRIDYDTPDYVTRVLVQHNQSANLQPADKMLRSACLHCHGLGFSIDALADRTLARANFPAKPAHHIASIEMAVERDRVVTARKAAEAAAKAAAESASQTPDQTP
jgi:formate-dependent nitrite reductase cytochrome c552 subunit